MPQVPDRQASILARPRAIAGISVVCIIPHVKPRKYGAEARKGHGPDRIEITVRLNEFERDDIVATAKMLDMPISVFVREAALNMVAALKKEQESAQSRADQS